MAGTISEAQPRSFAKGRVCEPTVILALLLGEGKATMTCHNCRVDCRSYGKNRNGSRRFRGTQCSKTFTEPRPRPFGNMYLEFERGMLPLEIVVEGGSIRSAERISGVPRNTIMDLLVAAGKNAEGWLANRIRNVPVREVQADEIWGFVAKKEGHKNPFEGDDMYVGDAWCFIGIERHTKLVLTFELGKRTEGSAKPLHDEAGGCDSSQRSVPTDHGRPGHLPDRRLLSLGNRVDYAQYIKVYAQTEAGERRYSPPQCIASEKKDIYGDPDRQRICTSHIERQNGSLRQCCKRLTRLTYAFSKKWENLKAALALHFAYYNFCRVHRTLETPPAVAAGLTDHVWTLRELLMEAA